MSQKNLKTVLKRICELQPNYTSENTPAMQERGKLIRQSLTSEIKLRSSLITHELGDFGNDFNVSASDGIGRKTEAPWVRFYSERMSPAPTEGYYFVIHFNRDGTALFLTVGCGSTSWKNGSLIPLNKAKLLEKTLMARSSIISEHGNLGDYVDQIELNANAPLPKTFEQATAIAKRISYNDIDETDFDRLLSQSAKYLQTVYEAQQSGFDLTHADQAELEIQDIIKPKRKKKSGGQGFGLSAPQKKAVELRAMELAQAWLENNGYKVKDTSANKPYDLLASKNSDETKVEVKGTTSRDPNAILMTANEVDLHRLEKGSTTLAIVSEIKLVKSTPPTASGGKLEMMIGWDIDEWLATPTAFRVERKV